MSIINPTTRTVLYPADATLYPADATYIGPWRLDDGESRSFTGSRRTVQTGHRHRIPVDIRGSQDRKGAVSRFIWVGGLVVTAAEARQLARHLVSAADELDRLSDADGTDAGRADA